MYYKRQSNTVNNIVIFAVPEVYRCIYCPTKKERGICRVRSKTLSCKQKNFNLKKFTINFKCMKFSKC